MYPHTFLAVLSTALVAGVAAQEASVTVNNPPGVILKATLPEARFFADADLVGNVRGEITAQSPADGKGVLFRVTLSNFPPSGGPFTYHLHAKPAVDGDCLSTKAHLDPFSAGEDHVCDVQEPALCQVGDLSGKHGKITSDPFTVEYLDLYASTDASNAAYFGDKSFVVHYANKTRITCANFGADEYDESHSSSAASPSTAPSPSSSSSSSSSPAHATAPHSSGAPTAAAAAAASGSTTAPASSSTTSSVPFVGAASAAGVSMLVPLAGAGIAVVLISGLW